MCKDRFIERTWSSSFCLFIYFLWEGGALKSLAHVLPSIVGQFYLCETPYCFIQGSPSNVGMCGSTWSVKVNLYLIGEFSPQLPVQYMLTKPADFLYNFQHFLYDAVCFQLLIIRSMLFQKLVLVLCYLSEFKPTLRLCVILPVWSLLILKIYNVELTFSLG